MPFVAEVADQNQILLAGRVSLPVNANLAYNLTPPLSQQNNLIDLKCSMQFLLVKIMYKNSHKAALKMLGAFLAGVEAWVLSFLGSSGSAAHSRSLDIPLWTYSFRLLRFHLLAAESSAARDDHGAVNTLRGLCAMAQDRRDAKMAALASLLEALVSFRNGADGVEAAQRALTRVFTQQNAGNDLPPQLEVLAQILDICCSHLLGKTSDCDPKVRKLHAMLDQPGRWADWKGDGEFEIFINPSRPGRPPEALKLRWLNKDDVFTLGYFLSGLCKLQKNVEESGKAERFLTEGLKTVERESKIARLDSATELNLYACVHRGIDDERPVFAGSFQEQACLEKNPQVLHVPLPRLPPLHENRLGHRLQSMLASLPPSPPLLLHTRLG